MSRSLHRSAASNGQSPQRPNRIDPWRTRLFHEALEDRRLLAVTWERIEPLGGLMFQTNVSGELGALVPTYSNNFESGSLGPEWSTSTSAVNGRIGVSSVLGTPAASGSFHLAMDTSAAGPFNLNQAILTVDLSGATVASLSFAHKETNDEDTALPVSFSGSVNGDGVSISADGSTWYRLVSLNDANSPNGVYTQFDFDLNAAASTAGIALGSNFRIKFQQYDDFPFTTDGRAFDDVTILTPGPSPTLSETTSALLEANQTLSAVATPGDAAATLTITVRSPGNVVLATATAAGPGETVDIQTVGIPLDGDYSVEVASDANTEYSLSLFRNATVEVVDSEDGNEQDATGSLIPLGSGRFGILGTFGNSSPPDDNGDIIDDFEDGNLDEYLVLGDTATSVTAQAAHDGNFGLSDGDSGVPPEGFIARLDAEAFVHQGQIISLWVQNTGTSLGAGGRAYFGFGLDAALGTYALVMAPNTGQFVLQYIDTSMNFFDIAAGAQAWLTNHWYRMEVEWQTDSDIIARLFDSNGTTLLNTVSANNDIITSGGIAFRAFGDVKYFDTVEILGAAAAGQSTLPHDEPVPATAGENRDLHDDGPQPADAYGDPGEPIRVPPGPGAAAQPAAPNELLINGSFETGNFSGWTTVTTGPPFINWQVTGAGSGAGFGMLPTQPQDGVFVGWNGFDGAGPMEFQMYQDVAISAGTAATLSWMDRVQWNFTLGNVATLPRLYDVEIRNPTTNAVLQNVFSFSTGTKATNPTGNTNWQAHSVDVSAFAGQTIRVFFREQVPQSSTGPAQLEFDAISLTTGQGGGADVDEYLLDLTGKAGQPIDVVLTASMQGGSGDQFNESLRQQNNVFAPNVLSFDFTAAPPPTGNATLRIDAIADLDGTTEFLTLNAEGLFTQNLFVTGGLQQELVSTTVVIPQAILAQLAADGTIEFNVTPSTDVNNLGATSLTLELTYEAVGSATLELLDTDGTTVLATGTQVADNFDLGILDFLVPADGIYTLRVSSQAAGRYAVVVTDPLVFDTEPNAPADASLRALDAHDGALGFLGEDISNNDLRLIESFEAMRFPNDSGFIPPDPTLAAGPEAVIAMVNTDIAIYNKNTGTELAKADLDGAGGFWATSNTVFDPWIVFDHDSDRFFAMGVDVAGGTSRIYLAVSNDATPTNLTTDWFKYSIVRTGIHRVTGEPTFPDYPKLGVNGDAIYITGNDFGISSGSFSHVSLFAIRKAPLLVGGAVSVVYNEGIVGAFSVHPVISYDAGTTMYFVEAPGGATSVRLHALSNVLTAPVRTAVNVTVPAFLSPPDVPQSGAPALDSVGNRFMSGVVRDGSLWTAHAIVDPAVDSETLVRWYEFDVSSFPGAAPTLVQSGNVDPGPGVHAWMTNISVDADGDMGVGFSVSGPSMFASIGYTGRLATDAPGTTRDVQIVRSGEGPYARFDTIGRNRWGDYSGLALDPDGETFWLYNEYAATGNNWATFVAGFQVEAAPVEPDFDTYTMTLVAGQAIGLSTLTPFDDPTDGLNLLDPSLELIDPNGVTVAHDSNSGGDGKNASISAFIATISGVYKVIVRTETEGAGEYVLSIHAAPVIEQFELGAGMIFENESVAAIGSYSDRDASDSHHLVVDWGDPNRPSSAFHVAAINTLSAGDTFGSSTDSAVLLITAVVTATGKVNFRTEHRYLDDGVAPGNGTADDNSTVAIAITDSGGLAAIAAVPPSAQVLVKNVGPQVVAGSVTDATTPAEVGAVVTLSGAFTDAGTLDRHTVTIDWGDSATSNSVLNPAHFTTFIDSAGGVAGSFNAIHTYAAGGIYTVTLKVLDDDTGEVATRAIRLVSGAHLTPDGILQILGTERNDNVTISRLNGNSSRMYANFLPGGRYQDFHTADIAKIVAYLYGGNDSFIINSNVDLAAIVHGGGGNDLLKAGAGPSVLLGEEGDDNLVGGNDRDILIGGLGADRMMGGVGDDLLIGGTTAHDRNDMALMDLLTEWKQDVSYPVRVDSLRRGTGPTGIKLAQGETVFDDLAADQLIGSFGTDWFFFDPLRDRADDRLSSEGVR